MPDDRKPGPPKRPSTYIGERGEVVRRVVTPVRGLPLPRQDDTAQDFASITAVGHPSLEAELAERVKRTQHVTEGIASNTLSFAGRLGAVERDVGELKGSVALVQESLDAQDKYLKPLVDVLTRKSTVEHTKTKATIELDTVKQIDDVKAKGARRERTTATVKTVLAVIGPAAAIVLGALHLRSCT